MLFALFNAFLPKPVVPDKPPANEEDDVAKRRVRMNQLTVTQKKEEPPPPPKKGVIEFELKRYEEVDPTPTYTYYGPKAPEGKDATWVQDHIDVCSVLSGIIVDSRVQTKFNTRGTVVGFKDPATEFQSISWSNDKPNVIRVRLDGAYSPQHVVHYTFDELTLVLPIEENLPSC